MIRRAHRSLQLAVVGGLTAALLVAGVATAHSGKSGHGRLLLDARMVGIPATATGQTLAGVAGGGAPWVLDHGRARIFASGRVQVTVDDLVFAAGPNIGKNTVPTGRAIVSCNGGADIVMSDSVPYSPTGDARVNQVLDLPDTCLGPVVFFAGDTANGPRWFAVTGN